MKRIIYTFFFSLLSFQVLSSELLNEPIIPIPESKNADPELVELGNLLFHDPQLSRDGTISCASCHSLSTGGVDRLKVSIGIDNQSGSINAPSVFNSSLSVRQFWDGRASNLMEQVSGPIENSKEMGSNWTHIINVLSADPAYLERFSNSFEDGITETNIKIAIVAFEESLVTPNSRFDQFLQGSENAITDDELAGYNLFKQYGCTSCHQGKAVGGNLFQKMGVMKDYFIDKDTITEADFGRFNVTKKEVDRFFFKVPGLRNVELTAPYFHDGSIETLYQSVEKMMIYQLGISPVPEDIQLIVQFLKTLTGEYQGESL
jgi:cytochrome c peroxidase